MADDKSLKMVLELRQREEDEAQEAYAQAQIAVRTFEHQLEQLKRFARMYSDEMAGKTSGGMDINVFRSYQNFLDKLEVIEKRQQQALENVRRQEAARREEYLEKQKRRKIIESLLEKHRQEELIREAKAEQKLTDDIVSSKQARVLMEKAKKAKLAKMLHNS